jgi:[acyl-carrier-protein] S-malonyltransferase
MLSPWLELPGAADRLSSWSTASGLDLARLGTTASTEEITDTAIAQPLIVAATLLAYEELTRQGLRAGHEAGETILAGHSVGEIAAYAIAGVISADDAVALAATRGAEMAKACADEPTGMSAVLGGDVDEVIARIEALGLTPANRNAVGQIVAAGALDALGKLAEEPPAGARVRPLAVAGAFHTHFMVPAADALTDYVPTLQVADPRPILLSNVDGAAVVTGADLLARLVRQVTIPVRWDLCLRSCADLGVTGVVELAPGGVLTGIAKRELPGVELVAVKSPADLDRARTLVASRPQHGQGEHTPEFRVVVTPAKGVFTRSAAIDEGAEVARGARIGTVRTNRDEHPVIAVQAGVLAEWLRDNGDIVGAGLPVARLANGSDY